MGIIISGFPCIHNKCRFCSYGTMPRSEIDGEKFWPEVEKEIELVRSGKQKYAKLFNGGSFLNKEVPHPFKLALLRRLRQANITQFRFENRFDQVDWDFLEHIIGMGITPHISWGFESCHEEVRDFCGKDSPDNPEILQILERVCWLGGKNILYVMAGLPMPDGFLPMADYKRTISWCHENRYWLTEVISLAYTPAKGSEFFESEWKSGRHRVISKEKWAQCKDYARRTFKDTHISFEFHSLQYWVYSQGKTWPEMAAANEARKREKAGK